MVEPKKPLAVRSMAMRCVLPPGELTLNLNADLAEEMLASTVITRLKPLLPPVPGKVTSGLDERQMRIERVRDLCIAYQCFETMTYPFHREETLEPRPHRRRRP